MLKFLVLSLLCMSVVTEGGVIQLNAPELTLKSDQTASDPGQWLLHIYDFVDLLDIQKLMMVAMEYMGDPEVMNFAVFVTSPQFSELVFEFESMKEFTEATMFLDSKGYDVEPIINFVNSALSLPPFEKPFPLGRNKKGISGLLQDIVATLPIEDMKELFQKKLETSPEVAELFNTINSEEFVHILKKMSENPKFKEFKETFESYGFDFKIICAGAKEIFGDYYQGIFCE